jgi:hypothetical protein
VANRNLTHGEWKEYLGNNLIGVPLRICREEGKKIEKRFELWQLLNRCQQILHVLKT